MLASQKPGLDMADLYGATARGSSSYDTLETVYQERIDALRRVYEDRLKRMVSQMKELVTRVQNDEAIAALKSSESTSDFVAFRIQELVDSSLQSEQEATIRRLTEEIAGFHVRSATVDSELSRLQSDNERLLSAVVNLRTVAQQAEDKAAHLSETLSQVAEQRAVEKETLRTKLEVLRKAMSSKADSEGTVANLHIENSKLHAQVLEYQAQLRSLSGSSEDQSLKYKRQVEQLKLQLERSELLRKDMQDKFSDTADKIEQAMERDKAAATASTTELHSKIDKLKLKLAASKQDADNLRQQMAAQETEHARALQGQQQSVATAHHNAVADMERRLHIKYEALLTERLASVQKSTEEEQRYRKLIEVELESVRANCITRAEHQRISDLMCKEAVKDAVTRAETDFNKRLQSALDDTKRRHAEELRVLRNQLSEEEDKLTRERGARKEVELKCAALERDYRNVQLGYTEAENARQLLASHLNECRQSLETTTLTSEKLSRRVAVLEQSLADEKDDSQKLRDQLRRFQSAAIADDGAMVSFQPGGGYASSGHRGWKSVVTEDQQRLETDIVQLRDANRVLQERVLELEHELSTTQERLKGSLSSAALAAETTAKKFGELQERCLSAETNAATMQTLHQQATVERQSLLTELELARGEVSQLRSTVKSLEGDVEKYSRAAIRAKQDATQLKSSASYSIQQFAGQVQMKCVRLKDSCDVLKTSVRQLMDGVARDMAKACRDVTWRVSEFERSQHSTTTAAKRETAASLERSREQWQAEFALREHRMTQSLQDTESNLQHAQTQLVTLRSELQTEQTMRRDAERRVSDLKADVRRLTSEYDALESELKQVSHQLSVADGAAVQSESAERPDMAVSRDVLDGLMSVDVDVFTASARRFSESLDGYKQRLRQTSIDTTLSPMVQRAEQAESELRHLKDSYDAAVMAEGVARREVQVLTSTCASLRSDIAHLESQLSRVQQELSSTLATTDTHAHRSTELEGTIANLKQQLSGVQELQRMYAEEKERATKYSSKVKELRVELLKVASDADKTIGEERGARQVAEREASEARKQLGLAMSKYKEKDEKVHELRQELQKSTVASRSVEAALRAANSSKDKTIDDLQSVLHKSYHQVSTDADQAAAELHLASSRLSERVRRRRDTSPDNTYATSPDQGPVQLSDLKRPVQPVGFVTPK